jgi:hypothetical protein
MDAVPVWTLLLHVLWTPVPWNVQETAAVVVSVTFDRAEDCREARGNIDQFAPLVMAFGGLANGAARALGGCEEEIRSSVVADDPDAVSSEPARAAVPSDLAEAAARWAGRIRSLDVRPATVAPATTAWAPGPPARGFPPTPGPVLPPAPELRATPVLAAPPAPPTPALWAASPLPAAPTLVATPALSPTPALAAESTPPTGSVSAASPPAGSP